MYLVCHNLSHVNKQLAFLGFATCSLKECCRPVEVCFAAATVHGVKHA